MYPLGRRAQRMGGRVVYGSGLENRRGCKLTVGSNPTPSAGLAANPPRPPLQFTCSLDPDQCGARLRAAGSAPQDAGCGSHHRGVQRAARPAPVLADAAGQSQESSPWPGS